MKRATLALALTLATATAVSAGQKPGHGNPHTEDKHAAESTPPTSTTATWTIGHTSRERSVFRPATHG